MIAFAGYILALFLFVVLVLNIVGRRRAIERALRDNEIALSFIAHGKAAPHEVGFAIAILDGDSHGLIPAFYPDFAAFRQAIIFQQERGI